MSDKANVLITPNGENTLSHLCNTDIRAVNGDFNEQVTYAEKAKAIIK